MEKEGPPTIPARSDLEKAYSKLLHHDPRTATSDELAVFSQWSRFDPRLAEIWVLFLAKTWEKFNPIELRKALLNQAWPAVGAVLLEFSEKLIANTATDPISVSLFPLWRRIVTEQLPKGKWEQFFIGLRGLGGQAMEADARFAYSEYRKWGYLGREILINKGGHGLKEKSLSVATPSLSPETRQEILISLLSTSARITTDIYWNAIEKCISRRQAERDLKGSSLLKARGKTKARYFLKRA